MATVGTAGRNNRWSWWGSVVLFWIVLPVQAAYSQDDQFIHGYARAVLDQEFRLADAVVIVHEGVLTVRARSLGGLRVQELVQVLERIPGVTRVDVALEEDHAREPAQVAEESPIDTPPSQWFPRGFLFAHLHADPRWPQFALAYRRFLDSGQVKDGAATNIGGTVSVYRSRPSGSAQWEVGFQVGAFSLFDLSAKSDSNDLLNTDFMLALFYGYRSDKFSALVRLAHQSNHLGDEFLQNTQTPRVEVNHDRLDLKLSYDIAEWLRAYGGGGLLLRQSPADLGMWTVQAGVELTSPTTYWKGRLRPVAYADFQLHERTQWSYGHSIMAGLQLETLRLDGRAVQLLAQHFIGPFPDGQFFTQKTQWLGIGVYFYF